MSKLQKNGSRQSVVSRPRANSGAASPRRGDGQISDPTLNAGGVHNGSITSPAPNSLHLRSNNSLQLLQSSRNGSTTQFYADTSTRPSPPRLQHKRSMNGLREASNPIRRVPSRSPARSITTTDPQVYAKSTPTKLVAGPKREKSTLKTVMRRLFRKKPIQGRRAVGAGPAAHHRSDPGVFITTHSDVDPARDSSFSNTEVTRASALGSHSPFAPVPHHSHDLPTTPEDGPQLSPEPSPKRRRATLPSIDFTPDEASTIAATLATYEHRPLSHIAMDERPHGSIGFAVTSGSNPKRRSRSAGALRDVAREHRMSPIQWRRLSDEVRCWRESLEEAPLAIPIYGPSHDTNLRGEPRMSPQDVLATEEPDDYTAEDHRRTFDFGPVASSMRNQEAASLEERLNTLEVKQMDLEYAISKLQTHGTTPAKSPVPEAFLNPPLRNASPESAYSSTHADREHSIPAGSGKHGHYQEQPSSVLDESSPGFLSATQYALHKDSPYPNTTHAFPHFESRPSSAVTAIHPSAGQRFPPCPDSQPLHTSQLTAEDSETLFALIKREQAARMNLEQQVFRLEQELHSFRSSYIHDAGSPHPPSIPSLASHVPSSLRPRQQRQGSEAGSRPRKKKSVGDVGEETDTDDAFPDVFETPKERTEFVPGGFF